jgi:CRISPR-associated protein Cas5d
MEQFIPLEVKVWGDLACFTRPEMKVERVSYSTMTPSAARGALEAIYWKPEIDWRVREIWVLRPVRYLSIRLNEINHRQSERSAKAWLTRGGGYDSSDQDNRAQRHTLALRDVAYRIRADIVVRSGVGDDIAKFRAQFRRRVERGQAHHQPYLGCREFAAFFAEPDPAERPIDVNEDLGRMLFDLTYAPDRSGHGRPRFFEARLERGVMRVPDSLYQEA